MRRPRIAHGLWVGTMLTALHGFAGTSPCFAADVYLRATVDTAGVRIERAKGRAVVLKKDREQVAFDKIAIAKGGGSVGWLALYPNCCTSYPIPLKLKVYSSGHLRTFEVNGLPIWRWQFTARNTQVAFEQEPVHGGVGIHYELRDVATGRLITQYDPRGGPEEWPPSNQDIPLWVAELDASR